MDMLKTTIQRFLSEEDGATMIEYGLLAALIALVVAAAVVTLGTALDTKFDEVNDCVENGVCPQGTP
ncbi:MAG TPA: Flp family type IVb pilin [Gemmatimonadaceae bacterium]|nr:Flp family type IVb pilin [Gemmatimonadaceae bacterium]